VFSIGDIWYLSLSVPRIWGGYRKASVFYRAKSVLIHSLWINSGDFRGPFVKEVQLPVIFEGDS
jgi:hypothetical protein